MKEAGQTCVLTTLGCKVNQFETETMEGLFKKRNYEIVDFDEHADFYIINTCSVTHLGEKKSRQLIRRAMRLNPQAIIAVTGSGRRTLQQRGRRSGKPRQNHE